MQQLQHEMCYYCQMKRGSTKDHILPKSKGGGSFDENIVRACGKCNRLKASLSLEAFILEIQKSEYCIRYNLVDLMVANVRKLIKRESTWRQQHFRVTMRQYDFCMEPTTDVPDDLRQEIISAHKYDGFVKRERLHQLKLAMHMDQFLLTHNY